MTSPWFTVIVGPGSVSLPGVKPQPPVTVPYRSIVLEAARDGALATNSVPNSRPTTSRIANRFPILNPRPYYRASHSDSYPFAIMARRVASRGSPANLHGPPPRIPGEMEAQAQEIAERLRSAGRVGVYCHIDADGITGGAIASEALVRAGIEHDVSFLKKLDEASLQVIRREAPPLAWF